MLLRTKIIKENDKYKRNKDLENISNFDRICDAKFSWDLLSFWNYLIVYFLPLNDLIMYFLRYIYALVETLLYNFALSFYVYVSKYICSKYDIK